jgi:hypothetical protein
VASGTMAGVAWKRRVVGALNSACTAVDAVAYRPAVVRLSLPLPRWWSCQLARLSMRLNDRWGIGYWSSDIAPAAPEGLCDACHRRAAWLVVGGRDEDDDGDDRGAASFLTEHPVHLCGWCRIDRDAPIETAADLDRALARARQKSVAWTWRGRDD